MSFIYAKIIDESINIWADSKFSFDKKDDDKSLCDLTTSCYYGKTEKDPMRNRYCCETQTEWLERYGIIKNLRINDNIAVCYAGDIVHANELAKEIRYGDIKDFDSLVVVAQNLHLKYDRDVDFILAYQDRIDIRLIHIADGECQECALAWIGDGNVFNAFRKREIESQGKKSIGDIFKATIKNKSLDAVGGFVFRLFYNKNENKFEYQGSCELHHERNHTVKTGDALQIYGDAAVGAYSVTIYNSFSWCAIYIDQGKLGILYNWHRANESDFEHGSLNNLWLPTVYHIEKDIFEKQIKAMGIYSAISYN